MSTLREELRNMYDEWDMEGIKMMHKIMKEKRDEIHEIVERNNDRWTTDVRATSILKNVQDNIRIVELFISDENLWDC